MPTLEQGRIIGRLVETWSPHQELAWVKRSRAERSRGSLADSIRSVNWSRLVALAIGAVMLGRAMSHASYPRAASSERPWRLDRERRECEIRVRSDTP